MRLIRLAATPAAFFLPSRSKHVTAGKLALISMVVTVFFLFTAGNNLPGGSLDFIAWAEAIVRGTTLPPHVASRDIGFPLLYILAGFPWSHSFVGITLILASFAVLIPVLVYWSLVRTSRTIAFYMGVVCIISLSPITYMKFFFHDQAYMFFGLLAVALLIDFLWCGHFRTLYLFTLAALAISFTRPAGNLMFPVLMIIAYVTVRGPIRHYLACALIFVLVTGAYQWHRYEIFDMRNRPSIPSGMGMQMFYSMYLYLGDFGYQLSPDLGPNTKHLLDKLQQGLQPDVRESAIIKRALIDTPPDFMEKHVYSFTPQGLVEKIMTAPNEEYYMILKYVDPAPNDLFLLKITTEIARSHPWYVIQYAARNLWHAVFDPGYASTRYNVQGYHKTGIDFVPGVQSLGVRSADWVAAYGSRAEREMAYFPLKTKSQAVQDFFHELETFWRVHFSKYVWITSAPIAIAWIGAFAGALCWIIPQTGLCQGLKRTGVDTLMGPLITASAFLLYEDLATALFSQPVYRYFHMTEPLRLVIGGFGLAFAMGMLSFVWRTKIAQTPLWRLGQAGLAPITAIQKYDLLDGYFGRRRAQWILLLVVVHACLFAWWTSSMIVHTWGPPPVGLID